MVHNDEENNLVYKALVAVVDAELDYVNPDGNRVTSWGQIVIMNAHTPCGDTKNKNTNDWEKQLFELLQKHSIKFLPFVPDAGHAGLIALSENSSVVRPVVLTTEEE